MVILWSMWSPRKCQPGSGGPGVFSKFQEKLGGRDMCGKMHIVEKPAINWTWRSGNFS